MDPEWPGVASGILQRSPAPEIAAAAERAGMETLKTAVAAGVRSGDTGLTLELMGDLASDLIELRSRLLRAAAYPLLVVMTAGLLLVTVVQQALDQLLTIADDWSLTIHPLLRWILQMNREHPLWVFLVPGSVVVIVLLWVVSGRASSMAFRGPEGMLLWLPGVRVLVRDLQAYTLARMLSLLIERGLPLDEALVLAGGSSGAAALERGCRELASQVQREGRTESRPDMSQAGRAERAGQGLPPLLAVCLTQVQDSEARLVERLRSLSVFYRNRLDRNASWLALLMPIVMFVVIGGGSALLYCGLVFWPVTEIYRTLAM
jgi:type II secretory pathway component PulF